MALGSLHTCRKCTTALLSLHERFVTHRDCRKWQMTPAMPRLPCRRRIEAEETWSQEGRPYEHWLCQLGDALLGQCRDPQLLALQKVARRRTAMMELVMLQLFASLALEGTHDDCDLSAVLATQVLRAVYGIMGMGAMSFGMHMVA